MKCGVCQKRLEHLRATCDCGEDPFQGHILAERYRLLGKLAEGGMGMIYRAISLKDDKLCAIKISRWGKALQELRELQPEEALEEERARVQREFTLLQKAASQSKNIVQVDDQLRDDPRVGLYYPMEFLEGQPLTGLADWNTPFTPVRALSIIMQVCQAAGIAHGLGVVHRDLNPDNIFTVRYDGDDEYVKLIDFGIARDLYEKRKLFVTGDDMAFGHLHYLAPEQVGYSVKKGTYDKSTASKLDHRADIYSIGAIMFHMLTGMPLFEDNTLEGLANRDWEYPLNMEKADEQMMFPVNLRDIILACLETDPELRPPDTYTLYALFFDALQDLQRGLSGGYDITTNSQDLLIDGMEDFAASLANTLEDEIGRVAAKIEQEESEWDEENATVESPKPPPPPPPSPTKVPPPPPPGSGVMAPIPPPPQKLETRGLPKLSYSHDKTGKTPSMDELFATDEPLPGVSYILTNESENPNLSTNTREFPAEKPKKKERKSSFTRSKTDALQDALFSGNDSKQDEFDPSQPLSPFENMLPATSLSNERKLENQQEKTFPVAMVVLLLGILLGIGGGIMLYLQK